MDVVLAHESCLIFRKYLLAWREHVYALGKDAQREGNRITIGVKLQYTEEGAVGNALMFRVVALFKSLGVNKSAAAEKTPSGIMRTLISLVNRSKRASVFIPSDIVVGMLTGVANSTAHRGRNNLTKLGYSLESVANGWMVTKPKPKPEPEPELEVEVEVEVEPESLAYATLQTMIANIVRTVVKEELA